MAECINLSNFERLVVLRFCVMHGTRLSCGTASLLRPLNLEELESAFFEWGKKQPSHDIRKSFSVAVDFLFKSSDTLRWHALMNPKVTFGYSNRLHEECDVVLNDKLREDLLACLEMDESKRVNEDYYSCGAFRYGAAENAADVIFYEDLKIWKNERKMLETVSHENIFTVFFDERDIKIFSDFEGQSKRNEKILRKLRHE